MKKNANALTIAYFAFFAMIMLSGVLGGKMPLILSEVVYYLAYILPFAAVMTLLKAEKRQQKLFSLSQDGVRIFLPTLFPTVLLIIILSYLTSALIFFVFGRTNAVDVGQDPFFALFTHALLPAVLEELLFRFLPLRFLAPYSKRYALIFSSVAFALAHHSFFSIPYAFFAGVIFMICDLLCESVLPSIILHFVNNAVSVIWILYFPTAKGGAALVSVIAVLSILSVIPMINKRKIYSEGIKEILTKDREAYFTSAMLSASLAAVFVAVFELAV